MAILWLTGNCGAGKTGLARLLKERIPNTVILDGDEMRASISQDCGFSEEDRRNHNRRIINLAKVLEEQGLFVIISVIAPHRKTRSELRCMAKIIWVYVRGGVMDDPERPYEEPYEMNQILFTNPKEEGFPETTDKILDYLSKWEAYTKPTGIYSMMIGRYQPFHDGHAAMVQKLLDEGCQPLVGIRESKVDEKNPYSYMERLKMIAERFPQIDIVSVPDIKEIVYGRGVGWNMRRINLDPEVEKISGTKIRASER